MSKLHLTTGSPIPKLPEDGKLRLYSMRFCIFAHRIHLVLDAKKIPYHTININLKKKPEWYTQKSALGKVPALEIPSVKGDSLIESLVIAEYLDEQYPQNPIISKDPLQRARDKILIERFISGINPIIGKLIYSKDTPEDEVSKLIVDLDNFFDFLDAELKTRGTTFLSGSKPGFADFMIWPWVERTETVDIIAGKELDPQAERFSHIYTWAGGMKQEPAVIVNAISAENHLKFIRSMNSEAPLYDILS